MTGAATPTGQWFRSGEGTRWYFDSGALCLDFAYTGGVVERPEWEQLRTPPDLAAWLAGHVAGYGGGRSPGLESPGLESPGLESQGLASQGSASSGLESPGAGYGARPRAVLAEALALRAAVLGLANAAAAGHSLRQGDIDVVNAVAGRPDVPRRLPGGSAVPRATVRQALSSVARDAVDVIGAHADRVRVCGASGCPLVFLDLSRAGNRRWCSMQRCGNRHKVRSHRARGTDPPS